MDKTEVPTGYPPYFDYESIETILDIQQGVDDE